MPTDSADITAGGDVHDYESDSADGNGFCSKSCNLPKRKVIPSDGRGGDYKLFILHRSSLWRFVFAALLSHFMDVSGCESAMWSSAPRTVTQSGTLSSKGAALTEQDVGQNQEPPVWRVFGAPCFCVTGRGHDVKQNSGFVTDENTALSFLSKEVRRK